mgnify:CR=1 FL=1
MRLIRLLVLSILFAPAAARETDFEQPPLRLKFVIPVPGGTHYA